MKKSIKTVIAVVALILVAAALIVVYKTFGPQTSEGSKNITITVVDAAGKETIYELKTDAKTLKEAMDEAEGLTYGGEDQGAGFLVDTVNGVRADYTLDGAYWSFLLNGEWCNYGIEEQPVNDGDAFSIEYTKAE